LRIEHQAVKDELARYKKLPPRPPQKPSGMQKATDRPEDGAGETKAGRSTRRRGSNLDKLKINRTVVLKADAPAGSRRKGYEEIVIQDLAFHPLVTCYRRERGLTPDGQTVIAPLDPGIVGGYGPHLHRLILTLHFQGQMTCERILTLLNGAGVVISKRQVVRLSVVGLEKFRAEDEEVLTAGLSGSRFVTVDDTGARHKNKSGFTTQRVEKPTQGNIVVFTCYDKSSGKNLGLGHVAFFKEVTGSNTIRVIGGNQSADGHKSIISERQFLTTPFDVGRHVGGEYVPCTYKLNGYFIV
jgi:hypothetical protein